MTQPIQFQAPIFRSREIVESPGALGQGGPSFGDLFRNLLDDASQLDGNAKELIAAFVRGDPVELHDVMAAAEEASISLQLLVELRNKLTEAYRTLMSLQ